MVFMGSVDRSNCPKVEAQLLVEGPSSLLTSFFRALRVTHNQNNTKNKVVLQISDSSAYRFRDIAIRIFCDGVDEEEEEE